ncbi:protein GVQW3-like [Palaemon carinicauda]|uniref:protein GVQW3-like n=1 Tax=Palaemon carinicauda TaxID=392227 RepID=UPI0035B5EE98
MLGNKEHRYAIKFCVKLKKHKQEAHGMLKEAYGDEQMSQASFYRWFNRFSEGNEQVEDEPRSGAPNCARKEENINEVLRLVMQDRRITVRRISEAVGISIATVETVLTEDLKFHKVFAKFVTKILSDDQKQFRVECCTDILEMVDSDSGFLDKVVTCDESWVFTYDAESNRQSAQWKHQTSPRPKKAKMSSLQGKAMVIPFFDSEGLIHVEWVPQGQTANEEYYLTILKRLREKMRKKCQQQWTSDQWWFHQDNAPCHKSTLVTTWMADRGMTVVQPSPSSFRLLPFPTHERQPQGNQIPVNRGVKRGIGKLHAGTTEEGL